jgi:hypothetical protein
MATTAANVNGSPSILGDSAPEAGQNRIQFLGRVPSMEFSDFVKTISYSTYKKFSSSKGQGLFSA